MVKFSWIFEYGNSVILGVGHHGNQIDNGLLNRVIISNR